MHKGRSNRSERKAVSEREGGGEEERAVLMVFVEVEGRIVVDDLGDVIFLTKAVVRGTGGDTRGKARSG